MPTREPDQWILLAIVNGPAFARLIGKGGAHIQSMRSSIGGSLRGVDVSSMMPFFQNGAHLVSIYFTFILIALQT